MPRADVRVRPCHAAYPRSVPSEPHGTGGGARCAHIPQLHGRVDATRGDEAAAAAALRVERVHGLCGVQRRARLLARLEVPQPQAPIPGCRHGRAAAALQPRGTRDALRVPLERQQRASPSGVRHGVAPARALRARPGAARGAPPLGVTFALTLVAVTAVGLALDDGGDVPQPRGAVPAAGEQPAPARARGDALRGVGMCVNFCDGLQLYLPTARARSAPQPHSRVLGGRGDELALGVAERRCCDDRRGVPRAAGEHVAARWVVQAHHAVVGARDHERRRVATWRGGEPRDGAHPVALLSAALLLWRRRRGHVLELDDALRREALGEQRALERRAQQLPLD